MENTLTKELAWVRLHMPRLGRALADLPDLRGVRLACSFHLEIKMVPLVEGLLQRGAELFLTTEFCINSEPQLLTAPSCPLF